MKSHAITFPSGATTEYHFDISDNDLRRLAPPAQTIVITDETVAELHAEKLKDYRVLAFPPGEEHKTLDTIADLATRLIDAGAQRNTLLLGVGGGVVTDITGYLGACFMRGVPVAFVPTTLLGQVDASIGGKNGVNAGLHKNMLGTIRQPRFICFDTDYLLTLPDEQWSNGFAEVLKYGHIADARILSTMRNADIPYFQKHPDKLNELIGGCVDVKNKIVHADEVESNLRLMLNFGHTAGHAFETLYRLPHGHAVGLGMRVALRLSEQYTDLPADIGIQLRELLEAFGLPATLEHNAEEVLELLMTDKKRQAEGVEYVLLEKPGVAVTKVLRSEEIRPALDVVLS